MIKTKRIPVNTYNKWRDDTGEVYVYTGANTDELEIIESEKLEDFIKHELDKDSMPPRREDFDTEEEYKEEIFDYLGIYKNPNELYNNIDLTGEHKFEEIGDGTGILIIP